MNFELGPVESWLHAELGRSARFLILVDPDRVDRRGAAELAAAAGEAGADGFLAGTSLMLGNQLGGLVETLRETSGLPVILFPGDAGQLVPQADAVLFISLISGRNPQYLIGEHVRAAPQLAANHTECLPTGYLLVESGVSTSAQFMSGSQPLPRNKPDIAVAHALAARALGLRQLYLEAGSGAVPPVPAEMIGAVKRVYPQPLIVGGGIRDADQARRAVRAGADVVVVGSALEPGPAEERSLRGRIEEFVRAVRKAGDQ